jgi:hypothetical protein
MNPDPRTAYHRRLKERHAHIAARERLRRKLKYWRRAAFVYRIQCNSILRPGVAPKSNALGLMRPVGLAL